MYLFNDKGHFIERIDADEGILNNGQWLLKNVRTDAVDPSMPSSRLFDPSPASHLSNPLEQSSFVRTTILSTDLSLQKIRESNAIPDTLSFWQLPSFIALLEKSGMSSLTYRMYFHKNMAQIGLMMAMIFLSAGFCLRSTRSTQTSVLISFCLLTGLLFHFLTDFVYALGLGGRLPPLLAAWLPPFAGILMSFTLLFHAEDSRR